MYTIDIKLIDKHSIPSEVINVLIKDTYGTWLLSLTIMNLCETSV